MNSFAWVAKMQILHVEYLVLHKCILAILKVATNADTTTKN